MLLLMAVYSFAIHVANDFEQLDFSKYPNSHQQDSYHSSISSNFLFETPSETTTVNLSNIPLRNLKKPFQGFWALVKNANLLGNTKYIQYNRTSDNLLIHFKITRLSFPFHYFW
ncbi:MAG: hypothetical protein DWP98_03255 [Bacteroidetes bacterium]|nr:MAG: hypothetical protein DWP98_03255 [Bacteroidota bacterium]MBL1145424.1 hypothetical protein [Bacteroidota bacterium]MCB0803487.1 hypothetical protein [Flavobacteriales bacterium]NOG58222.1 hypothetical protein [Bacteroidota bacterium]